MYLPIMQLKWNWRRKPFIVSLPLLKQHQNFIYTKPKNIVSRLCIQKSEEFIEQLINFSNTVTVKLVSKFVYDSAS